MKGIQNTTTQNFSDLIGKSRKYFVPKFQRDYSWDLEQWDDLWQDILIMTSEEGGDHYFCDKRRVYEKSEYADCKSIAADYEAWTERSIAERQKKMARKAKSVWKLN